MNRKSTLKDYARRLIETQPVVTPGPSAVVELLSVSTGKIRFERIRLDWWEDEDFRDGYEACADDGFVILSEKWPPAQATAELDT